MRHGLPLTAVLMALGAGAAPRTTGSKIAVVEPAAPVTMVGLAAQLASWVAAEARAQGAQVISPDDLAKALGEDRYAQLQACRGDPTCVTALALPLSASRLVVGTLDRDEQSYLVHLWLVELPRARPVAELERAVRIATRRLGPEVRSALPAFLRGEVQGAGLLDLRTGIEGASVQIDGTAAGSTPLHVSLPPGRHEVTLQRLGYLSAHHWVAITAGKTTKEDVPLVPAPGVAESRVPQALPSLPPAAPSSTRGGYSVPLGAWIVGGIAVAAAGTGLGFGISSMGIERRLRGGFNPARGTYEGTRADAIQGRAQAVTANILFASAGAAALTALGIALFAPGDDAPHASLLASPDGGGVTVGGRF